MLATSIASRLDQPIARSVLTGGGASAPPTPSPLMFATQANAINKNRANRSRTDVQCRWACRIGSRAKKKLAVAWMAWSAPAALGNDLPIYMALVEYNGVTVPLTWSGSRSVTITNNTNGPISDELDALAFGVSEFPRGATIYVKSWVKFATTTQFIPYSARDTAGGGQVWWFNAAETVMSDFDAPGAITRISGVAQDARTQGMQPMVLGRDVPGAPGTGDAWFIQGSSSTEGVGDASTFLNYGGWAGRSMVTDQNTGADPVSYCNFAVAASTTDLAYGKPLTNYWMQFANKGIISYGSNNLNTGGTGSLSSMQAQLTSAINNMRDNGGIQHILTTNLQPRTDSTDSWATLANQSAPAGWDVGGTVQQYNTWQAGLVGTLTQGHILHNGIRAGTDPDVYTYYRWWTNGTANWPTTDGTHPSAVSHEAMAVGSRPFVYP